MKKLKLCNLKLIKLLSIITLGETNKIWLESKNSFGFMGGGVIDFNTYLLRGVLKNDTDWHKGGGRGGLSKSDQKINTYYLNGPLIETGFENISLKIILLGYVSKLGFTGKKFNLFQICRYDQRIFPDPFPVDPHLNRQPFLP